MLYFDFYIMKGNLSYYCILKHTLSNEALLLSLTFIVLDMFWGFFL